MEKFQLQPSCSITEYAGAFYIFDVKLGHEALVRVPTRRIESDPFRALRALILGKVKKTALSRNDLRKILEENDLDGEYIEVLIGENLLIAQQDQADDPEARLLARFVARYGAGSTTLAQAAQAFEREAQIIHYSDHTFFNLPREVATEACQVGLIGVPLATMMENLGSVTAPDHLRAMSRGINWLKVHQSGFYGEVVMAEQRPERLCKGIVIKDFGDVPCEGRSVEAIFATLRTRVKELCLVAGIAPIFVGGDHAITFPIVDTFAKEVSDLHLLHLDAHNDLFYAQGIVHTHSAPISNLVQYSPLGKILSFGLRTFYDHRTENMERIYGNPEVSGKLALYSLLQTKNLILHENRLRELFRSYADKSFYLTIDLDVLTADAIGQQLSTPMGEGLGWHELLFFLDIAFSELRILACDITEFNALAGSTSRATTYYLNSLLLLLIDRLAKNRRD